MRLGRERAARRWRAAVEIQRRERGRHPRRAFCRVRRYAIWAQRRFRKRAAARRLYKLLAARLSKWKRAALHTLKRHAAEALRREKQMKRRAATQFLDMHPGRTAKLGKALTLLKRVATKRAASARLALDLRRQHSRAAAAAFTLIKTRARRLKAASATALLAYKHGVRAARTAFARLRRYAGVVALVETLAQSHATTLIHAVALWKRHTAKLRAAARLATLLRRQHLEAAGARDGAHSLVGLVFLVLDAQGGDLEAGGGVHGDLEGDEERDRELAREAEARLRAAPVLALGAADVASVGP